MILVITESEVVFRRYFSRPYFRRLAPPLAESIRGMEDCKVMRFGRYWECPTYADAEREFLFYCRTHNNTIIDIKETK